MYCIQCGEKIPEGQHACQFCGANLNNYSQTTAHNSYVQPQFQYQNNNNTNQYYAKQQNRMQQQYGNNFYSAPQEQLGMRWYKFIIHVQLFLSIIAYFLLAIVLFTGAHYGSFDMAEEVYLLYPDLATADKLYGVGVFCLAFFAIVVRNMLKKFKTTGPMLYYIFLVLRTVISCIYLVAASSAMNMSLGDIMTSGNYISFLENIILLCVNIIYFGNRKHLFVK